MYVDTTDLWRHLGPGCLRWLRVRPRRVRSPPVDLLLRKTAFHALAHQLRDTPLLWIGTYARLFSMGGPLLPRAPDVGDSGGARPGLRWLRLMAAMVCVALQLHAPACQLVGFYLLAELPCLVQALEPAIGKA